MEYKDFISKLHIKGAWLPKDEFTKQLFESAVRDNSVITDKRSYINTFKGYNRGNPINEIAYDVINDSTYLKESGIEVFIEKYLNNAPDKKSEYVQKICDKFKNQIPDITHENICKKIANFFIEKVLKPAAEEYENTRNMLKSASTGKDLNPIPETHNTESSTDNYVEVSDISIDPISIAPVSSNNCYENYSNINIKNTDIDMIQNLIIYLSDSIDALLELGDQIGIKEYEYGWNNAKLMFKDLYTQFSNAFEEFSQLNRKLNFYYQKYQYELLEYSVIRSQNLTKDSFLSKYGKYSKLYKKPDSIIYDYQKILAKISSVLDESDSK